MDFSLLGSDGYIRSNTHGEWFRHFTEAECLAPSSPCRVQRGRVHKRGEGGLLRL